MNSIVTNASVGRALIVTALFFSSSGSVIAFAAGRARSQLALTWARRFAWSYAASLVAATIVMEYALVTHDFSVSYVTQVGSRATPLHITLISLWSSLEGSILFWGLILAGYLVAFLYAMRDRRDNLFAYALGMSLAIGTFFAFLIAGPANPFLDTPPPIPLDGPGPNPLLQNHLLMIVHPPMLYLGYVGMTIPFSMGIAALLGGRVSASWSIPLRRWMLVPWGFLSAGIVLGGWWAYEVLGWGGYWAWDPVENASFLPWLTATAFLHAAILQERRGILKGWSITLVMATFILTILGTFMTRSGVFNSVHSFTQSDIGPTLLVFLTLIILTSVVILALRLHHLTPGRPVAAPISREAAFVFNNLLFVIFTFSVLVGTTFPLVAEAIRGVKLSVGEPFFDRFALPIGVAIVFLMGVGPALPWGTPSRTEIRRALQTPTAIALFVTAIAFIKGARDFWPAATIFVSVFAAYVTIRDMIVPIISVRHRSDRGKLSVFQAAAQAFRRGHRRYGGQIVHLGICIAAVAIAISGAYKVSAESIVERGKAMTIGGYSLRFVGVSHLEEAHRARTFATFDIAKDGRSLGQLKPAMNHYRSQMNPIGSPDVYSTLFEDLYLSVMQIDPKGAFVGLRAYINPGVYWLWGSLAIVLFGCMIALIPTRARRETIGQR